MACWADDYVILTNVSQDEWSNWEKIPHCELLREFKNVDDEKLRDYAFPKEMYLIAIKQLGVKPFVCMSGEQIIS